MTLMQKARPPVIGERAFCFMHFTDLTYARSTGNIAFRRIDLHAVLH